MKIKGKDLALYFSLTEQTISNYKNSKQDGYKRQYEALKAYYEEVLSDDKKYKENYTMDLERGQVYVYGDMNIDDLKIIKNHFEGGVTLCINATFKDDNWEWDYDIPLEWN